MLTLQNLLQYNFLVPQNEESFVLWRKDNTLKALPFHFSLFLSLAHSFFPNTSPPNS